MNLLMTAPLRDSRGKIRYFIGAQVDVSGLVKECADLDSLRQLVAHESKGNEDDEGTISEHDLQSMPKKDEFQELSEMLNIDELDTVRRWGGRMHRDKEEEVFETGTGANWNKPRILIHGQESPDGKVDYDPMSHQWQAQWNLRKLPPRAPIPFPAHTIRFSVP
jgi:hypothetical protein